MKITLGYGRGSVSLDYDAARFTVLDVASSAREKPLSDAEIGRAIDDPIGSPPLDRILTAGDTVLVVASDATRATASGQILNLLVRRLIECRITPRDIAIIFSTGIHRHVTKAERQELLTPFIAQRVRTIDHDAGDPENLISLGDTGHGTPIEVNRAIKEFDHLILTGGIGFHYFAGFTGGRKSICPGLASARTIAATHMLALDFESGGRRTGVGTGLLDGNAVHEECQRIAALVAPGFLINTVTDGQGRAARVYAGDWREAHRAGCEEFRATHSAAIPEKRPLVIASCGGAPFDINMIQAHKALDMASQACVEGGTIVLLAECGDGLGRPDFLKWFDAGDSRAIEIRLREHYEVNGQTAWSLLTKAERFQVRLVSMLPEEQVRAMRLVPERNLDEALAHVSASAAGFIVPRGASILPVIT